MALLKIENQTEPTQNQAYTSIYDLAREISYYIADPRALNTILTSRRQARNLMENLKLDKELVYKNAEPVLKDWVHILTFETDNAIIEELTVIQKIRDLVLALSEELKDDSGFATYYFQIETLSKLELEATERLKLSKKKVSLDLSIQFKLNNLAENYFLFYF